MSNTDTDLKNALQGLAIAAAISARESALLTCAWVAGESMGSGVLRDSDEKVRNQAIANLQNLHVFFANI